MSFQEQKKTKFVVVAEKVVPLKGGGEMESSLENLSTIFLWEKEAEIPALRAETITSLNSSGGSRDGEKRKKEGEN